MTNWPLKEEQARLQPFNSPADQIPTDVLQNANRSLMGGEQEILTDDYLDNLQIAAVRTWVSVAETKTKYRSDDRTVSICGSRTSPETNCAMFRPHLDGIRNQRRR
jgi:hypothetical protein